jgi:hypothetical protein
VIVMSDSKLHSTSLESVWKLPWVRCGVVPGRLSVSSFGLVDGDGSGVWGACREGRDALCEHPSRLRFS